MKGGKSQTVAREQLTKTQLSLLVVVMVCGLLALPGVSSWEKATFDFFYSWSALLWPIFLLITQLGSVWFGLAVVVRVYQIFGKARAQRLAVAILVNFVAVELIKHVVSRPRPSAILESVASQDVFTRGGYGFPSGHCAEAALLAVFAWTVVAKKHHLSIILTVVLVGISRMYLGMHLPLDIIGGLCVGAFTGLFFFSPKKRLAKGRAKA